jgi:hypothetical protein
MGMFDNLMPARPSSERPSLPPTPKETKPPLISKEVTAKVGEIAKEALPTAVAIGAGILTKKVGPYAARIGSTWTRKGGLRRMPSLQPSARIESANIMRQAIHETLGTSRTHGLPAGYFSGLNSQAIRSMKGTMKELQKSRRLRQENQAIKKAASQKFKKNYELGSLILATTLSGITGYAIEKEMAKADQVKSQIGEQAESLQQKGAELKKLHDEQQSQRLSKLEEENKELDKLIAQLPENERAQFHQARQEILQVCDRSNEISKEEVEKAIANFNELSSHPVGAYSNVKDFAAQLAGPFVGLAVALASSQLPLAKAMIQKLVNSGLPEHIVEKVIIGSAPLITEELARKAVSQNVTEGEVRELSANLVKQLAIDSHAPSELTKEEAKLHESLTNTMIGVAGRFISSFMKNELHADALETAFNSMTKVAVSESVDAAIEAEQAEKIVQETLKPAHEHVNSLQGRIEAVGKAEREISQLSALRGRVQENINVIQQQNLEAAKAKSAQELAAGQESMIGWAAKKVWSWVPY